jgi:CheY-like chemotaxis protein
MLPENLKALIVDDEPIIRNLMKIFLGNQANILESKDGAGALEVILAEKLDVVFLDINLPGALSGINVLRVLRQDPELKHTHVVIVSALSPQELAKADVLKADAYITKPFCKQDLLDWYAGYEAGSRASVLAVD